MESLEVSRRGLVGAAAAGAGVTLWNRPARGGQDFLASHSRTVGWVRRIEGAGDSLRVTLQRDALPIPPDGVRHCGCASVGMNLRRRPVAMQRRRRPGT